MWRAAYRWRWLALGVGALAAVIGAASLQFIPTRYEATGRIAVDTQKALKPLLTGLVYPPDIGQQVQMLASTLISRPNVERLLEMPALAGEPALEAFPREELIGRLMRDIKFTPSTTPGLYQIAYRGPTPEVAAKVVDATFELFGRTSAGSKLRNSQDADFFLKTQLQEYAARVTEAENRLDAFKARHFGSSGLPGQDYFARIATLNAEVDKLRVEASSAEQVRNALRRELATSEPALPLELTPRGGSTPAQDALARFDAERKKLDDLRLRFTDVHPEVVAARVTVERLEAEARRLNEMEARALAVHGMAGKAAGNEAYRTLYLRLRGELTDAETRAAGLGAQLSLKQSQLAQMRELADRMPRLETEMAQLKREQEIAHKNYEQILARSESASLGAKADVTAELAEFRIVEPTAVSRWPAYPGPLHGAVGLLLLAPLLGLAAAALAEWLRPAIHDARSLRLLGDRPVLGTVSISHTPETQRRERLAGAAFTLAFVVAFVAQAVWLGHTVVVPIAQRALAAA
jgi:polysaccharide chain length determinant protein (PEP-CTERM system associated)